MKNLLLSFALFFLTIGQAQDIYLGAKAGVNSSTFSGVNTEEFGQSTGYHVGASAEFSFSEYFSSEVELLYSTKGASSDILDISVDYLSLPVMIKVYPIESISIDVGPQFSYLLNNSALIDNIEIDTYPYETLDIGLIAGITYKTGLDIYIQARYVMGVTEFDPAGKWKNQVFQFSLGYNFM